MVKMASGMDHGRVCLATTYDSDDVAKHGGHPQLIPSHAVLDYSISISLISDMHITMYVQLKAVIS